MGLCLGGQKEKPMNKEKECISYYAVAQSAREATSRHARYNDPVSAAQGWKKRNEEAQAERQKSASPTDITPFPYQIYHVEAYVKPVEVIIECRVRNL